MATIDDEQQVPVEPAEAGEGRGPHGWVRIVLALALGLVAGAVIALLLPREDGPRRAVTPLPDPARQDPLAPPAGGRTVRTVEGATVEDGPGTSLEG